MDVNTFRDKIKLNFKDVDANFFSQIEKYKLFLQDYNKKINLTRLADEEKIYGQYFFESVIPYRKFIFEPNISILDIGSGSGIPGIALLLLFPKIKLTIIESNNKKCSFLAALAKHLGIDVEILCKRAEDITASEREKFDLVTSRAVAPLKNILELSIPYTKINGWIIEPKSSNCTSETQCAQKILKLLKSSITSIDTFTSDEGYIHNVVYVKKHEKTDTKYPRSWKVIINE